MAQPPPDDHQTALLKRIQELTGQVVRIDLYSFACGGYADVFKGEYLGRRVSMNVPLLFVSDLRFDIFQVAVKVFKVPRDREMFDV